jgi:hypothetical protein
MSAGNKAWHSINNAVLVEWVYVDNSLCRRAKGHFQARRRVPWRGNDGDALHLSHGKLVRRAVGAATDRTFNRMASRKDRSAKSNPADMGEAPAPRLVFEGCQPQSMRSGSA